MAALSLDPLIGVSRGVVGGCLPAALGGLSGRSARQVKRTGPV